MTGTKAGGLKAAATNAKRYGANFYRKIGTKGGQNGHTGGFAANPKLARIAGSKGGHMSIRGASLKVLMGKEEGKSIRMTTQELYKAWLPQVFKIYNKACNTNFVFQNPQHQTDYYEQLKNFIHDDKELVDEKVTMCMAVLYEFYKETHGRYDPQRTVALTEIKTLVTSLSTRSMLNWTQAKNFQKEWGGAEAFKNVQTEC